MRIAIDATPLCLPAGGLARYVSQLAGALARQFPEDEYVLVSDQPFALPFSAPNLSKGNAPANAFERRWWAWGLQRELKRQAIDVFHGVNFAVPFRAATPAVMTIHDLSPWSTAAWASDQWRARTARIRKQVPLLIRTGAARAIVTPSEAIRHEVITFFDLPPEKVTAIPHAAAPHFYPRPTKAKPYFLYAGMFEPRKNVTAIIDAWTAMRADFDVDLVIAGPRREEVPPPADAPGLEQCGVVSDDRLAELYSGATGFIYPSHYEGFGLPVLEAMQCGAPVVISRDPALCETAGDVAMRASSVTEIADAMRALLEDGNLRDDLRVRSLARAAAFSWEETARATREVYRRVSRG